jgi:hypothetical protein
MGDEESLDREERLSAQLIELNMEDTGVRLREDLLLKCQVLLSELEEFQRYLANQKKDSGVELRHFKNSVRTEVNSLEKVGTFKMTLLLELYNFHSAKLACQ